MALGTDLCGFVDSPAATATNSIPPKEYKVTARLLEKAEMPPTKAWSLLKFVKTFIND